jgi:predicted dehydrogenase
MSPGRSIRTGLVGSGFSASFHVEALHRVAAVNLTLEGVYSPTRANREAFAAKRDIPAVDSLDALIDRADVIHVCTPPATHESVALAALAAGKSVVIEKPYTGYFGDGSDEFNGDTFPREDGLRAAMESVQRIADAERASSGRVLYAENWVYAPAIQKEREIIEKTGAQILWMHGEEAHSGSHSQFYGIWKHSGGGSVMGKSVHPLSAALYLKQVEGRARDGRPIRPATVSSRVHAITRMPRFRDTGHLRTTYTDIEDFGVVHIVFEDGTIADIFASELVHGGVHNWIEVNANNHRTICNINPNTAMQTYNPVHEQFSDIYTVEKTGTKQGWSFPSPDEDWFTGYQHEMDAFYRAVALDEEPESGSMLGGDTIAVVYSAYLSAEKKGTEVPVPLV